MGREAGRAATRSLVAACSGAAVPGRSAADAVARRQGEGGGRPPAGRELRGARSLPCQESEVAHVLRQNRLGGLELHDAIHERLGRGPREPRRLDAHANVSLPEGAARGQHRGSRACLRVSERVPEDERHHGPPGRQQQVPEAHAQVLGHRNGPGVPQAVSRGDEQGGHVRRQVGQAARDHEGRAREDAEIVDQEVAHLARPGGQRARVTPPALRPCCCPRRRAYWPGSADAPRAQ
mmetsp:Transcript_22177/g.56738  ORF Transcript_22177/g.56738 Transcript_22177/m.56738 type:complete len:236 (+) Transcript_22177:1016-1723(+)